MSLCLHVSISITPCLHLHVSISPCFRNSAEVKTNSGKIPTSAEFHKSTSGHTLLQMANSSVCLLQTETEHGSLFPW
jgi:hypothetical protein